MSEYEDSQEDGAEDGKSEELKQSEQDSQVVKFILQCREESRVAKFDRMKQNDQNRNVYHLRHDFSHKAEGQSLEVLSMQPMAVEQNQAFFQQALADMGDWWSTSASNPKNEEKMIIKPKEVHAITSNQLEKADMLRHVGLGVKSAQLGALVISKIHGCWEPVPAYVAKKNPNTGKSTLSKVKKWAWRLKLDLLSQKNYYPDPTGEGLYEIEDMWVDYHKLLDYSEGPYAIYDHEVVEKILSHSGGEEDSEETTDEQRRGVQNEASHGFRNRVKLTEFWGTILDTEGKVLHENCVCTIADDKHLIRKPTLNPNWSQESPYVAAGLFDIDEGVWPKALMDAPSKHNIAANEVYNLMMDGGMRAANNIGQIRTDWLDDAGQVENGIKPGTMLKTNSQCPPGAKVLEMVQSGMVPPETLQMFSIQQQEFNRSALTSEARTGAMQLKGQSSATAVVESSNTLNSVFSGISKNLEQRWIQVLLKKAWMTCAQCLDEMDHDELRSILPADRVDEILALSPEEIFAATVQGIKFKVYGITLTLQRAQDFQKIGTMLQTIGASEVLLEAFSKKYSFDKLLTEAFRALGFDTQKLELSQSEQGMMAEGQTEEALPAPGGTPDQMSQVTSPNTGSLADQIGSAAGPQAPRQAFPASKATPA